MAFCPTIAPLAGERELYLTHLDRGVTGLGNLKIIGAYVLQIVRSFRLETARDDAQDEVLRVAGFVSRRDFRLSCQCHTLLQAARRTPLCKSSCVVTGGRPRT